MTPGEITVEETREAFGDAVRGLMRLHGYSYRELATRTRDLDPEGVGLSNGHIANLVAGRDRLTPRALDLVARALDREPEYFAEQRLALARALLDERGQGLDRALAWLDRCEDLRRAALPKRGLHIKARTWSGVITAKLVELEGRPSAPDGELPLRETPKHKRTPWNLFE